MRDHHVQSDSQCVVHAIDNHAQGIANQQDIDPVVQDRRDWCGVGGQADKRLATLAGADVGNRNTFLSNRDAHRFKLWSYVENAQRH